MTVAELTQRLSECDPRADISVDVTIGKAVYRAYITDFDGEYVNPIIVTDAELEPWRVDQ